MSEDQYPWNFKREFRNGKRLGRETKKLIRKQHEIKHLWFEGECAFCGIEQDSVDAQYPCEGAGAA